MKRSTAILGQSATSSRRAATLAEVLVSIMILSIGIVGLLTLFPISILRSLQATQLTNATILRFNAETVARNEPPLVCNPDGVGANNTGENYIVDPLGWNRFQGHPNEALLKQTFGNRGPQGNEMPFGSLQRWPGLPRFNIASGISQTIAERNAINAVTLPDSWVDVVAGEFSGPVSPAFSSGIGTITLPAGAVLSDVAYGYASPFVSQVVLFDPALRQSHTRIITNINGQDVEWSNDADGTAPDEYSDNGAIPAGFQAGSFRIQTRELRYTWLLSVRQNASARANVEVVVFFRRTFSPEDETVHDATFVANGRRVGIDFNGTQNFAKKGGFVFDVTNARWYRIQQIEETAAFPPYDMFLTLEEPAESSAGEDRNLNGLDDPGEDVGGISGLDYGRAIIMRGVVEVFPIDVVICPP